MWNFSCFSETRRNLISTKTKRNANARVWGLRFVRLRSTINAFYFFRMLCRNYKISSWTLGSEKINKNKITWNRGGQTGDDTRKVSHQRNKSSRIGDPTGRNIEPCPYVVPKFSLKKHISCQISFGSITLRLCGRHSGLMGSTLDSGASGPGSSPGRAHCIVFLGKTCYSHSASLHPGHLRT